MTLYEAVKSEENLTLYLNTTVTGCTMDGARIRTVRAQGLTTETAWEFSAAVFIDCTGSLAMRAGARTTFSANTRTSAMS